jgi:hypothetical protein
MPEKQPRHVSQKPGPCPTNIPPVKVADRVDRGLLYEIKKERPK